MAVPFNGIKPNGVALEMIRVFDYRGAALETPHAHGVGAVLGAGLVHEPQGNVLLRQTLVFQRLEDLVQPFLQYLLGIWGSAVVMGKRFSEMHLQALSKDSCQLETGIFDAEFCLDQVSNL